MNSPNEVTFLKNGGSCSVNDRCYLLVNTCAFDSVAHALAVACLDNVNVNDKVSTFVNAFCELLQCMLSSNNNKAQIDSLRA